MGVAYVFVPCVLDSPKMEMIHYKPKASCKPKASSKPNPSCKPKTHCNPKAKSLDFSLLTLFFVLLTLFTFSSRKLYLFDFAVPAHNKIYYAGEDAFSVPVSTPSTFVVDGRSENFYNTQSQWSRSDGEIERLTRRVLRQFTVYRTTPSSSAPHLSFGPFAVLTGPPQCLMPSITQTLYRC